MNYKSIVVLILLVIVFSGLAIANDYMIYCGNQQCDEGENSENCPIDCGEYVNGELPAPPFDKGESASKLFLGDIMIRPEEPVLGDEVTFFIMVRNAGPFPFDRELTETLMIDGKEVRTNNIRLRLGIEEEKTYDLGSVLVSKVGEHVVKVRLDYVVNENTKTILSSPRNIVVKAVFDEPNQLYESRARNDSQLNLYLIAVVLVIIGGVILLVYFIRRRDKDKETSMIQKMQYDVDDELSELLRKKDELEDIIKIAKVKFYKRKLDEDSYKEIVKDNQQKLIKIEARIGKIEKKINKLETRTNNIK